MSFNKKGEETAFQGRINRKLNLLLIFVFIVVLLIGAISVLSARSIYSNSKEVEEQIAHIEAIDVIHVYVHRLVFGVQESIINETVFPDEDRQRIIAELKKHLDHYLKMEEAEKFPEKEKEMNLFLDIRKVVTELVVTTERLSEAVASRKNVDGRDLRYLNHANTMIPVLALETNKIHKTKIARSMSESQNRMWTILGFYLAFVMIGSLLILGSNLVFQKSIVQPIRRLVAATVELSKGDFRKRVPVTSQDEIGQLAYSFNVMAERLEEHEATLQTMATQEERQRIAQELHDSLAQDLGLIQVKLGAAEVNLARSQSTEAEETLRELRQIVDGAYEDVRQSIFGLRTMVSRGLGLIPTLTEYLHDFCEMRKIVVDLKVRDADAGRLSPREEIQLIRIVHEALTNMSKHAQAMRGTVKFERDGNFAKITIEDDGKGFIVDHVIGKGLHFGLQTMKERAEQVGGKLTIDSSLGKGTRVIVHLPLEERSHETHSAVAGR